MSKVCHINLSTCILSSGRIYVEGVGFGVLMQLRNSKEEVEVRSIAPSVILITAKFIPLQLKYVQLGSSQVAETRTGVVSWYKIWYAIPLHSECAAAQLGEHLRAKFLS